MSVLRILSIAIAAIMALAASAADVHAAPKRSGKAKQEQAATKTRVVVLGFEGKEGDQVRKWVLAELKQLPDSDVISDKRARSLGKPQGDDAVEAARKLEAAALLSGAVVTKKKSWELKLAVINGADGAVVEEIEFKGKNKGALKDDISQNLLMRLADPLARSKVPEAEKEPEKPTAEEKKPAKEEEKAEEEPEEKAEPEKKPEEEEKEQAEPAGEDHAEALTPLEIWLGARGYSRNFDYNDDLFKRMRTHEVKAAPSIFLMLRWYPLAHGQSGMLANLGITGGYEQGFATTTEDADGRELKTNMNAWFVGLRGRVPLNPHELGLVLSYGQYNFGISGDEARPFPDASYQYLGFGLDGRFRFGRLLAGFHAAHRQVLDTGELGSAQWFPHISGAGFVGGIYGGQSLGEMFDLMIGFDIQRYYFDMNAVRGDAFAVGGAVDQYLSLWGAVSWRLPGPK